MTAKRVTDPPDSTAYNKYSAGGHGAGDPSIAKEYRSAESEKKPIISDLGVLPLPTGTVSPHVLYTVRDAAQILDKAPVTIRKEARTKEIGTIKGQGYLFTDHDVLALSTSFKDKENSRRHPLDKPSNEISVARALFEQVVYLRERVIRLEQGKDRFLMMFQEIFDQYRAFQEDTQERLKKLERRS